jgi:hypothetical protein
VLGGPQHWCDFEGTDVQGTPSWGECTSTFQNDDEDNDKNTGQKNKEAEYLMKNLFNFDIQKIESTYGIKITRTNTAHLSGETITRPSNTFGALKTALRKKLEKTYPFEDNGFSRKGILVVGLVDPLFAGFKKDIELPQETLQALSREKEALIKNSCFASVVLVNELADTNYDADNDFYIL